MEHYRCGRCHTVLAAVAAPGGEPSAWFLDPLVERRLMAVAAQHRPDCVGDRLDPAATAGEPLGGTDL